MTPSPPATPADSPGRLNTHAATAENTRVGNARFRRGAVAPWGFRGHGFSLLELIVVVVILAIISAIAAPRYSMAIQRYRLEMAANRVAADISLAKSYARAKGSSATISFSVSGSTYSIAGLTSTERLGEAHGVNLSRDPFGVSIQSVDFAGTNTLTIKGYGTPTSGGTVRLRLGDLTKVITVTAGSGEVSVQ